MRGMRDSGFVISLALVASLVGHFAIQKHFERRARGITSRTGQQIAERALRPASKWLKTRVRLVSERISNGKCQPLKCLDLLADSHISLEGIVPAARHIIPKIDVQGKPQTCRPAILPAVRYQLPPTPLGPKTSETDETNAQDVDTSAVRDVIEHELSTHDTR